MTDLCVGANVEFEIQDRHVGFFFFYISKISKKI
jgi:hypothetical protein